MRHIKRIHCGDTTMAYAQWVTITLQPRGLSLSVQNAKLEWGKFYSGDKDNEVSTASINEIVVADGQAAVISSCGRSDASSGTEGSFDLYDGPTFLGTYAWDCPWGSKTNTSTWTPGNESYISQVTGANLYGGALGNVTIKIAKF
jgi:hypothetical protein